MKLLVSVLALSLLTGCAQFQAFEAKVASVVKPDNFDTITIAFAGVEATGKSYRNLCERKVISKSCWVVIATLQPYEKKAYNSYIVLKQYVRSNPNDDASSLIQLTRNEIDALKDKQLENGVK